MKVDIEKCKGCGLCVEICPLELVSIQDKIAQVSEGCVSCLACVKVCPTGALSPSFEEEKEGTIRCDSCPVGCLIPPGGTGACKRFTNKDGNKVRTVKLHSYEDVLGIIKPEWAKEIKRPLITAIGAGTTYPDYRPAPFIVKGEIEGVDVVTVVTEAPLSYSGVKVKIDTDMNIGEEGTPVFDHKKHRVGHITTEEYGSKIISIGGANTFTGKHGLWAAFLVAKIANRRPFILKVKDGPKLELQVGKPPIIDGKKEERMRVGCGSASMGMFAMAFKEAADEVVVIDSHITGLFTEHTAGKYLGVSPSGLKLKFKKSTPGRYFGDHGEGWGGTSIKDPLTLVEGVDEKVAKIGMTILFTETTGRLAKMYKWLGGMDFEEIELGEEAKKAIRLIKETSELSLVNAVYMGGTGGSARVSIVKYPIRLTKAIHDRKAKLTVGGASTFIFPGGGITFCVDVSEVKEGAFSWIPTPCTVAPLEFTMKLEDYEEMGGYLDHIIDIKDLIK